MPPSPGSCREQCADGLLFPAQPLQLGVISDLFLQTQEALTFLVLHWNHTVVLALGRGVSPRQEPRPEAGLLTAEPRGTREQCEGDLLPGRRRGCLPERWGRGRLAEGDLRRPQPPESVTLRGPFHYLSKSRLPFRADCGTTPAHRRCFRTQRKSTESNVKAPGNPAAPLLLCWLFLRILGGPTAVFGGSGPGLHSHIPQHRDAESKGAGEGPGVRSVVPEAGEGLGRPQAGDTESELWAPEVLPPTARPTNIYPLGPRPARTSLPSPRAPLPWSLLESLLL